MSGSLVFSAQQIFGRSIPLFNEGRGGGLILRPGVAKVNCGKAKDSAGTCRVWHQPGESSWCPSVVGVPASDWAEPADTCGRAWQPQDFGVYLERLTTWQQQHETMGYNEIIIDAVDWRMHLPRVVEAIFGDYSIYTRFIEHFRDEGVSTDSVPYLTLDVNDWESPFRQDYAPRIIPRVRNPSNIPESLRGG